MNSYDEHLWQESNFFQVKDGNEEKKKQFRGFGEKKVTLKKKSKDASFTLISEVFPHISLPSPPPQAS